MTPGGAKPVDADQDAVVLSWSGGKDSALTLEALRAGGIRVRALLATVTEDVRRVSMHGVREDLLVQQARAVGVPLAVAYLPRAADNETYKERFGGALRAFREEGIEGVAFGDIHLADVREWREAFMAEIGLRAVFPIWGDSPRALVDRFIGLGGRAWVTCVDPEQLSPDFAGRPLDADTLRDFPEGADPGGENGEYHSFVWDGPWLAEPVDCRPGRRVERDGFVFCDLEPANSARQ